MILNDYYITGPAGLQSFFRFSNEELRNAFELFWRQIDRFKEDLSPDKWFYWDDALVDLYYNICVLLDKYNQCNCLSNEEIQSFAALLRNYLGVEIPEEMVTEIVLHDRSDVEHVIIEVSESECILDELRVHTNKTCLHKIEVSNACNVNLRNNTVAVPAGECLYVVAYNGNYVLLLQREINCRFFHLRLINKPGVFASDLVLTFKTAGFDNVMYTDVTSFSVINDRDLIVVHSNGNIEGYGASALCALGFKAIYTVNDLNNSNGLILYEGSSTSDRNECFVKSTFGGLTNAHYASFNANGVLSKQC